LNVGNRKTLLKCVKNTDTGDVSLKKVYLKCMGKRNLNSCFLLCVWNKRKHCKDSDEDSYKSWNFNL